MIDTPSAPASMSKRADGSDRDQSGEGLGGSRGGREGGGVGTSSGGQRGKIGGRGGLKAGRGGGRGGGICGYSGTIKVGMVSDLKAKIKKWIPADVSRKVWGTLNCSVVINAIGELTILGHF